jgi:hypothetical protein
MSIHEPMGLIKNPEIVHWFRAAEEAPAMTGKPLHRRSDDGLSGADDSAPRERENLHS